MTFMNRSLPSRTLLSISCAALVVLTAQMPAHAKVSAAEAAKLKNELTPYGAPRKGNGKDIPDWKGGITEPPKEYERPGQHHPNPFADEKPLFTIDSTNMSKYASAMSDGLQAMVKTYASSFKVPVFTSHRTHAAPKWVYENTFENATSAELVDGGNGIKGAYGGVPFPILEGSDEQKGLQAIWNHITRYRGIFVTRKASDVAVQRNGEYTLVTSQQEVYFNYYNPEGSAKTLDNVLFYYLSFNIAPARKAGGAVLIHETVDQVKEPRQAWGYDSGQRRVRKAPNLAYDSPIADAEGLRTADDTDMYNGSPDRYDWKYMGMREMYIPYNSYKLSQEDVTYEQLLDTSHLNPDLLRFEKHRVHVVEAKLKKGERHIYGKRVFYIDADSWNVAMVDQYDTRDELWRVSMAHLKNFYELPTTWTTVDAFYDLRSMRYHVQGMDSEEKTAKMFTGEAPSRRYFSPQALRRRGR
ncbi:MAG: outer membrane lipoprotein-sorting protein [unclassified Hahellaceae]|nr:outer membrane lipoprotein-sorting protein [Hahellaceae bacterium]